jgi:alpha-beta hydrolase superfamily lysophospholipase
VTEVTMTVETATTRDGTEQLRRRWQVADPRAALLVVHGIGEHSGRYQHVGRFFAERGVDVVGFDNRGFGRSGGRRGHVERFDVYLDDIEDRLTERRSLGVPVVLLGHSLGGLMAASYLVSDRPQPGLAVLSSPALAAEVPRWQRVAAPVLGRLRPTMFFPAEIEGDGLSRDPEVQRAYATDPLLVAGATAGLGNAIFRAMERVNAGLERLRVPTYVLHGDADPVVPISASRPLASLDPVTYRVWPGLRHECLNEPEQDQVMGEVDAWLGERLAGGGDPR